MLLGKSKIRDIIQNLIKSGGIGLEKAVNDIIAIYTVNSLEEEVVQDLAFMVKTCVDTNGKQLDRQVEGIIDYIQLKTPASKPEFPSPLLFCKQPNERSVITSEGITPQTIKRVAYIEEQKTKRRERDSDLERQIENLQKLDGKKLDTDLYKTFYKAVEHRPKTFIEISKRGEFHSNSFDHKIGLSLVNPRDQYFLESQTFLPLNSSTDRGYSGKTVRSALVSEEAMFHGGGDRIKEHLNQQAYEDEKILVASLLEAAHAEYLHPSYCKMRGDAFNASFLNFKRFLHINFPSHNKFFLMHPKLQYEMVSSLDGHFSLLDVGSSGTIYGEQYLTTHEIPEDTCYALLNLEPDTIEIYKEVEYYRNESVNCDFGNTKELGIITKFRVYVKPTHFRVVKFNYEMSF